MKKALLLPFLFLVLHVQAQEGTLDPTFGNGGFVHLGQTFIETGFTAEGKLVGILLALNAAGKRNLIRYNTDGTLDASYGSGGVIQIPPGVVRITVRDNGGVLVLNEVSEFIGSHVVSKKFVLTLYRPDGSQSVVGVFGQSLGPPFKQALGLFSYADKSWSAFRELYFGYGFQTFIAGVLGVAPGFYFSDLQGTTTSQPFSMTVSGEGKIYVGGTESGAFNHMFVIPTRLVIQRFNSNGVPDFTYGTNSIVASTLSAGISELLVQADGKLLGSFTDKNGSPENKSLHFNVNGNFDATFDSNGVVTAPFKISKMLLQADGKIIVGGTSNGDFALARYNADGNLDSTFGNGGTTTTDFGGEESISKMNIYGNRLYVYGSDVLASYRLNTSAPPCSLPTFLNNSQIVLDASCTGNDGNISIIPTSGTAPFLYSTNGGAIYVEGPASGYTFQNLAPGTYQLRLKDAHGCESSVIARDVHRRFGGPTFLNDLTIVRDVSCFGNDGLISIIPLSGTAPFMYSIDGGVTYAEGPSAGYSFMNLSVGTYFLRLKDSRGCESGVVQETLAESTTLPPPLALVTHPPQCSFGTNGSMLVLLPGEQYPSGETPEELSIDSGKTYRHSNFFGGLSAGTYYLKARYGNCESPVMPVTIHAEILRSCFSVPGVVPEARDSSAVVANKESVYTYPNPSRGALRVQLKGFDAAKVQLQIIDSHGVLIECRQVKAVEMNTVNMDLAGKAKGFYFVRVISEKGVQVQKVLVQ